MAMPVSYQRVFHDGLERAKIAVAMDVAGDYQAARVNYFAAANALNEISRIEVVPQRKELFREKVLYAVKLNRGL